MKKLLLTICFAICLCSCLITVNEGKCAKWESGKFKLCGDTYKLPCKLTKFKNVGYTLEEENVIVTKAGLYVCTLINENKDRIVVHINKKGNGKSKLSKLKADSAYFYYGNKDVEIDKLKMTTKKKKFKTLRSELGSYKVKKIHMFKKNYYYKSSSYQLIIVTGVNLSIDEIYIGPLEHD